MDRGAWWATDHGIAEELDMTQQLNNNNITRHKTIIYAYITLSLSFVSCLCFPLFSFSIFPLEIFLITLLLRSHNFL